MLEKLQTIITKYETLREQSLQPEIFEDMEKAKKINKELAGLEKTYDLACAYKKALETEQGALEILNNENDPDLLDMAKEELEEARTAIEKLDYDLKIALLPKDPNDDKKGRKPEIVEEQLSDIGGVKFVMVKIAGDSVYSLMKFES